MMVSHKGTEATKERPILFNGEMVRAILDGRKTQTRRIVKPQPELVKGAGGASCTERYTWDGGVVHFTEFPSWCSKYALSCCPYGKPGDRLWVRESMKYDPDRGWRYLADGLDVIETADYSKSTPNCPSVHMPRKASRILLEITDIRVERVQDITEEDAKAEGVERPFSQAECDTVAGLVGSKPEDHGYVNYLWHGRVGRGITAKQADSWTYQCSSYRTARDSFSSLWNSINAKRGYGWDVNPWVWVVEFRRIKP